MCLTSRRDGASSSVAATMAGNLGAIDFEKYFALENAIKYLLRSSQYFGDF